MEEAYAYSCEALENWYVLFVMTGQEDNVRQRLEYSFEPAIASPFLPKRMLIERKGGVVYERIRILFPSYLFMHSLNIEDIYMKLKRVPGVIKVIKDDVMPLAVPPYEMEPLIAMTKTCEIIGISTCSLTSKRIVVVEGPLKGQEGIIVAVDKRKGRAKVSMRIMGSEHLVDLGLNIIGAF